MLGTPELLVILVVIVVIFGPGKVSDISKALGRSINDFNKVKETGEKMLKEPLETVQNMPNFAEPASETKQGPAKPPTSRSETS